MKGFVCVNKYVWESRYTMPDTQQIYVAVSRIVKIEPYIDTTKMGDEYKGVLIHLDTGEDFAVSEDAETLIQKIQEVQP